MKKFILVTLVFTVLSTNAVLSHAFENGTEEGNFLNGTAKNNVITGKGQVVLINIDRTMITLKHEPITAIQWPAMTMAFKVKNSAVLSKTKVGDKVIFTLTPYGKNYNTPDRKNYMVTSIK